MAVKHCEFELGKFNYTSVFEVVLCLRTMERMTYCAMLSKEQVQIDFAREIHFTNE